MPLIRAHDRNVLRSRFQSAQPFPWLLIDDFLEPDFASEVARAYPPFEIAAGMGRQFKAVNENRKVQVVDYASFPTPVQQLSDALSSAAFLEELSYVTGIEKLRWDDEFSGGGMHQTARSGWLDVHVDFNFHPQMRAHRRLNILVFLNPEWDERWGGVLELWDREVTQRAQALVPRHNRCVLFETSDISWHGVTAVECPDGIARKSFAAYYYTDQAPAGWDGSVHSTIFRARPDEYFKRHVSMPAEAAQRSLVEGVRQAKSRVKRLLGRD